MPATSRAQQAAMAIAEHNPSKLNPSNRGMLGMSQPQLHDFAATPSRGLPQYAGRYPKLPGMADGGAVQPPPSLYAQGGMAGDTDVSQAGQPGQPILPNTPGMDATRTTGYAKGGSVLSAGQRRALPTSDFAVPSKAPGSGSYPINNASHARNALARSSGKPVAGKVRAAVSRKFPGIGKGMAKGGVAGGTDPQTEAKKPPLRGRLSRSQRVKKFEDENGDAEI